MQVMKNKAMKLKGILSLILVTLCDWTFETFKMLKALMNWFIPKYVRTYNVHYKPHLDIYTLLLPTTFVPHFTFHVFKLMLFNKKQKEAKLEANLWHVFWFPRA